MKSQQSSFSLCFIIGCGGCYGVARHTSGWGGGKSRKGDHACATVNPCGRNINGRSLTPSACQRESWTFKSNTLFLPLQKFFFAVQRTKPTPIKGMVVREKKKPGRHVLYWLKNKEINDTEEKLETELSWRGIKCSLKVIPPPISGERMSCLADSD